MRGLIMDKNKAKFKRPTFRALTLLVITLQLLFPMVAASSPILLEPATLEHHDQHEHHELEVAIHSGSETSDCSDENCHCECPSIAYSALIGFVDLVQIPPRPNAATHWIDNYRFQHLKAELRPPRFS